MSRFMDKNRAQAISNLARILFSAEVKNKLEERKCQKEYNMRSVVELAISLEGGSTVF